MLNILPDEQLQNVKVRSSKMQYLVKNTRLQLRVTMMKVFSPAPPTRFDCYNLSDKLLLN